MIRTYQTYFPGLTEAKFTAQRCYRRISRRPHESDFAVIAALPKVPEAVFLDVGGNRGQSLDSIRLYNKACRIHSFEPNPILAGRLRGRYRNDSKVTIHEVALGKERGEITLFVPRYRGFVFDGLASLCKDKVISWLRNNMLRFDERHLSFMTYVCRVERLDDLSLAPYFIKLDIQGGELEALLGARTTLSRHEPALLVEGGEPKMFTYLREFGYDSYTFVNGQFVPGARPGCNALHLTAKHFAEVSRYGREGAVPV
jgi:FkbM family methyltransferase